MFLLQSELTQPLEAAHPKAIDVYYEEREKDFARGKLACIPSQKVPFVPNEQVLSQQPGSLLYKVACRWLFELGLTMDHLRLCVVQSNISKVESKYKKEKAKKHQAVANQLAAMQGKAKPKKKGALAEDWKPKLEKLRHFQPKQLADTVESITGAIAYAAGLFSAQDFLIKLEVLKYSYLRYEEELAKFVHEIVSGKGYQQLLLKYSG